ncbi:MAG TPA: FkbM family methyltransferase, partial [Thermoanaerobaculia bacterium]|nr:FkbM family methyltransferase [Thermoanaerobaculia bacterium]
FLLPGFGDHYPDMALGLYRDEPFFRQIVDECCDRLRPELGFDLREQLFPGLSAGAATAAPPAAPGGKRDLRSLIRQKTGSPEPQKPAGMTSTAVHAAVFVVEIALARLLMKWGIRPRAMLGYSLGEYSAACLAGVFSLADGLTLVARRARLIEELPAGAMLAVPLPVEEIEPLLRDGVGIAAVNGPAHQVVSGPLAAVEALEAELTGRGVLCRRLQAHHAGHSSMLEPIAGRLRELVAGFKLQPPEITLVSNVTGTWIRAEEATDPDYWVRHLLGTVRFGDGLTRLFGLFETGSALLEVGPGQSLTSFAKRHPAAEAGQASLTFATLRAAHSPQPDRAFLLSTLGRLWMAGVPVEWAAMHPEGRKRLDLPSEVFGGGRERVERIHVWPNGMRIVAQTQTEAEHFYQDIFEKRIYLRHGVTLGEGACVFDVGANIGTFLLFAHQMSPGALLHSFEPAPPLFAKLRRNAELNGVAARLFNAGISDQEGTARFTFYPRSSGMSSFHADKEQEKDILRRMMETEREAGVEGVGELMGFAEDLLEERFRSETFECRLRPLSDVIAECAVEWIDLLKIDVQKAELEVLHGIREEHWPRIGQIVMEVHDLDGRLERIVRMLEERGFRVAVEQDELLIGSVLYNLFAVGEGAAGPGEEARERQRQAFQIALRTEAAAQGARPVFGTAYAAPGSELERTLAEIWQRALHVERVGIDDDFFDL